MNQKGFSSVLFFVIITAILVLGYFAYNRTNKTTVTPPPVQVACTQEAKVCPDGSSVGRVAPKCDFAACPSPKESTSSANSADQKAEEINFNGRVLIVKRVKLGQSCEGYVGSDQTTYQKCDAGLKCQLEKGTIQDTPGTCVKE